MLKDLFPERKASKWTEDLIKQEAGKYKSKSEFKKGNFEAYQAASKIGILQDLNFENYGDRGHKRWTEDEVRQEASKYNSRGEFQMGSQSAYGFAYRNKMLDDLFGERKLKWTDDEVRREASKYKYRGEFQKGSYLAYSAARKRGMLDDLFPERKLKWTEDKIRQEASKYASRGEFQKGSSSAYQPAKNRGMLDDLFPKKNKDNIEESIIRILREETSSYDGDENGRYKVFYGFQGIPNLWSDDYGRVVKDSYFDDKVYNDYYFDNFYDMDKEFGHKESHFGTRGLPVGHPNRSSKSFDMYNDQYGPAIVRVVDETNL